MKNIILILESHPPNRNQYLWETFFEKLNKKYRLFYFYDKIYHSKSECTLKFDKEIFGYTELLHILKEYEYEIYCAIFVRIPQFRDLDTFFMLKKYKVPLVYLQHGLQNWGRIINFINNKQFINKVICNNSFFENIDLIKRNFFEKFLYLFHIRMHYRSFSSEYIKYFLVYFDIKRYFVFGEYDRKLLIENFKIIPNRIKKIGYYEIEKIDLNIIKKVHNRIIYVGQSFLHLTNEKKVLLDYLLKINKYCIKHNIEFFVSIHPGDISNMLETFCKDTKIKYSKVDMIKYFEKSDLVISHYSTILHLSVLLNIPAIVLDCFPDFPFRLIFDYSKYSKNIHILDSVEKVEKVMTLALKTKKIKINTEQNIVAPYFEPSDELKNFIEDLNESEEFINLEQ